MGNPTFYYYPSPQGNTNFLKTIDMGEPLAEFYTEFQVDASTSVAFDGSMYRTTGVHREVVTIQRDRMKLGEDLAIKFQALQNHLDRGGSCAFSVDSDKSYCFPLSLNISAGDLQASLLGDPFRGFTGNKVPVQNDYVTIESQNPQLLYSQHKIASFSATTPTATISSSLGGQVNLSPASDFTHSTAAFLRWYRFFPTLKRDERDVGKSIITNEYGRLFTLNIRLVVDYQVLFSHHPNVGEYLTQEPSWGPELVEDYSVVFPPTDAYTINLDNSNPQYSTGTTIRPWNPNWNIRD